MQKALTGLILALAVTAAQADSSKEPIRLGMIEGMSGSFANAGEAVARNIRLAIDKINAKGGVRLPSGSRPLALNIYDNKQGVEESLIGLKQMSDKGVHFILQGNSSAVAAGLIDAINKNNDRRPDQRMLFLNTPRSIRS